MSSSGISKYLLYVSPDQCQNCQELIRQIESNPYIASRFKIQRFAESKPNSAADRRLVLQTPDGNTLTNEAAEKMITEIVGSSRATLFLLRDCARCREVAEILRKKTNNWTDSRFQKFLDVSVLSNSEAVSLAHFDPSGSFTFPQIQFPDGRTFTGLNDVVKKLNLISLRSELRPIA
jgi:hypothetical protein